MKTYKHYSFDLWMTLIKSDPAFKLARTKFFYDNFNTLGKTQEEIGTIFRQIDVMCNAINEQLGGNIDAEEMYLMVISAVNNYQYPLQDVNVHTLYREMEELVFRYSPIVYCQDTPEVLDRLQKNACSISLLSNTAFIKGSTLRRVLENIGLDQYFDFQIYSDETGMSKPNKQLFELMLQTVKEKRSEPLANLQEIIHVGDNISADIKGAELVGISSFLINSNNKTILNLLG